MLSELNGEGEGTFTDKRDGKVYKTVKIGNQVWMAENLNHEKGEGIAILGKCYNDNSANGEKYGRLYDWETAIKAVPLGWHLPSIEEWNVLINFVGGKNVASKHLKAKRGWEKTSLGIDNNGEDIYGFTALPGGSGNSSGNFFEVGNYCYWWSSSENGSYHAYYQDMDLSLKSMSQTDSDKRNLFSIRCIKD